MRINIFFAMIVYQNMEVDGLLTENIYPCFWHKVIYLWPVILVKWPHWMDLMLSEYLLSLEANPSTRYSLWLERIHPEKMRVDLFVVWSSFPIINLHRLFCLTKHHSFSISVTSLNMEMMDKCFSIN